jgi:hypothetical protein
MAQTMHLWCTETNTTSKRTESRLYMTHDTKEFHRVRPKWFLRLWYIWCKLWTYLIPRLTLSLNGPNKILHDPHHQGVPSGVSKKWFPSLRYIRCKLCTYLESRLALYPNGPKWASVWASSPRSIIRCIQNDFLRLWNIWRETVHLSCTETNTAPNGPKWASI